MVGGRTKKKPPVDRRRGKKERAFNGTESLQSIGTDSHQYFANRGERTFIGLYERAKAVEVRATELSQTGESEIDDPTLWDENTAFLEHYLGKLPIVIVLHSSDNKDTDVPTTIDLEHDCPPGAECI